jgi:hypothetical protein
MWGIGCFRTRIASAVYAGEPYLLIMACMFGLRHRAGALALTALVSSVGCGLVSGLDRLQEALCTQSCGHDSSDLDSGTLDQADEGSPTDPPDVPVDALPAPNEANAIDATPADDAMHGNPGIDANGADATSAGKDASVTDATPGGSDGNGADVTPRDAGGQDVSVGPQCTPITSGLVGHWTMDVASISGTRLADSSGNHNDGTLVGFSQPLTAAGRFGEALVYPASSAAYVHVPVLPVNQTPGGMNTISIWFYRRGTNISDVLAFLPSPNYDLGLTGSGTGKYLCINTASGECFGIQDTNLRDRWVHVVAIFANGPITMGTDRRYALGSSASLRQPRPRLSRNGVRHAPGG